MRCQSFSGLDGPKSVLGSKNEGHAKPERYIDLSMGGDMPTISRETMKRRLSPGKASRYIKSFDTISPGDKVVLWCRVSSHVQNRNGNLADQEWSLRCAAVQAGAEVLEHFTAACSGVGWSSCLCEAVQYARKHGAKLVAESTDRFIRHPRYHSVCRPDAQARDVELDDLASWTQGVELVTFLNPETSPSEVRSYQSKRGQAEKQHRGGRPKMKHPGYKRRRRAEQLAEALQLRDQGNSIREIASQIGVPKSTIGYWCQSH
jgi:DNA invertase Pin-like site-specific DNA recombinase